MSSKDRIQELADLVASGAASPEETVELDRLLSSEPDAAAIYLQSAAAASLLAEELEPIAPPPAALERIRSQIRATSAPARSGSASQGDGAQVADVISLADRRRKRSMILSIVMAGAMAASTTLWIRERRVNRELAARAEQIERDAESNAAALRKELAQELDDANREILTRFQPVSNPDVQLAQVRDATGAKVNIFVDPNNRRWLVFAFELPQPAPDKDYQLWFVPPEGKPISAGLLQVGPDGVLSASPDLPEGLGAVRPAISLEKKGGAEAPTDIKLVGETISI